MITAYLKVDTTSYACAHYETARTWPLRRIFCSVSSCQSSFLYLFIHALDCLFSLFESVLICLFTGALEYLFCYFWVGPYFFIDQCFGLFVLWSFVGYSSYMVWPFELFCLDIYFNWLQHSSLLISTSSVSEFFIRLVVQRFYRNLFYFNQKIVHILFVA